MRLLQLMTGNLILRVSLLSFSAPGKRKKRGLETMATSFSGSLFFSSTLLGKRRREAREHGRRTIISAFGMSNSRNPRNSPFCYDTIEKKNVFSTLKVVPWIPWVQ